MNKVKERLKKNNTITDKVYFVLRILVVICMIREIVNGNMQNALLCVLSLILFLLPVFVEKTFKVDLPQILEVIILIFIFSAEILGEINNFYGTFPYFDAILHTLNGFLCASVGFSLIYLLNENIKSLDLTPFFIALVSFCFSMTIGVFWEFFEYGMDKFFSLDMQKDEYVYSVKTVTLDPKADNNIVSIDDIHHTIIYDKDDNELVKVDGYLDVGLNDTMNDLIVNFIGALVFSIFGYLYIINKDKYNLAGKFLTKRKIN